MAGFQSVVGKKGEKSVELSAEKINELNPDYIGLICCGYNLEENKLFANKLYEDSRINNLDAIKNEQVFAFDSNSYFSRPSLRIMDGAEQLREAIFIAIKIIIVREIIDRLLETLHQQVCHQF